MDIVTTDAYDIEVHKHLFAAWAAGRAASVNGCRFPVEDGRLILESSGFTAEFANPDQLPSPTSIDTIHRNWRLEIISAAHERGFTFSHGIAAKLINIYLKSRFVCAGYQFHPNVAALHPPIDRLLLESLADHQIGGLAKKWRKAEKSGWSKFSSNDYEDVISMIKAVLGGRPLWTIEEHWRGNQ